MTALTADRNTPRKSTDWIYLPVAAGAVIHGGAQVCIKAGFVVPGSEDSTLIYIDRAEESVDNSAGQDGDRSVNIYRNQAFLWENDPVNPVTQAQVGTACYILDDQTVSASSNSGARATGGKVISLDNDGVWAE